MIIPIMLLLIWAITPYLLMNKLPIHNENIPYQIIMPLLYGTALPFIIALFVDIQFIIIPIILMILLYFFHIFEYNKSFTEK